ncbi:uncharacterized protein LOC111710648 [Eurytemora carolleeae]|uniref:uncharacterized protein LOC111710648 n=1 Tax=Eurytemora carolleeae TaxID=1294199 RepID=UPI000C775165|nr:uncharacterized protein LOC111710648 [Eurytemora carolleeae]|eukprot:XP_023340531.1 uncharacterized protein LOC111710648 [Eurytemora affinis]
MFIGRIIFDTIFFLGVAFVFNKKLRNYVKRGIRKVSLNSLIYGVWRPCSAARQPRRNQRTTPFQVNPVRNLTRAPRQVHPSNSSGEAGLTLSEPRRNISPEKGVRYPPGENTGVISHVPSSRIIYTTSAEIHLQPAEEHQSNSTNLEQTQEYFEMNTIITDFHQTMSSIEENSLAGEDTRRMSF